MKYSIILPLAVMILSSCSVQLEIPKTVQTAFITKFPAATDVGWESDKDEYEADFKFEGMEMSANFSKNGSWIETEQKVKTSALPNNVVSSVSKLYPNYLIEEVEIIETQSMKGYELEIEKGKVSKEVVFDVNGLFLKEKIANAGDIEADEE